jgi:D-beta-D-heptose 7-phosphate kinase/D-beta-D-heptose 1-phosphate adenosyltransferase
MEPAAASERTRLAPLLAAVELGGWALAHRAAGRAVVLTNGCFDLLHGGHVQSLLAAAALGDVLLVAINSDQSVRRIKGEGRPVQDEQTRALVLRALRAVSAVTIFDDSSSLPTILEVRPDVLAKGAEYATSEIVGGREVAAWGGRVVRLPMVAGAATTFLIDRMRAGTRQAPAAPSRDPFDAGGKDET